MDKVCYHASVQNHFLARFPNTIRSPVLTFIGFSCLDKRKQEGMTGKIVAGGR